MKQQELIAITRGLAVLIGGHEFRVLSTKARAQTERPQETSRGAVLATADGVPDHVCAGPLVGRHPIQHVRLQSGVALTLLCLEDDWASRHRVVGLLARIAV